MIYFDEPVTVRERPNIVREFRDIETAARWLVEKWPGHRNKISYREAIVACTEALQMKATPAYARMAFIAAAKVAGLLPHYH